MVRGLVLAGCGGWLQAGKHPPPAGRQASFPDSRKTAFSIPKSPLQGGLGMELPAVIPRFPKNGVFYSQVASPGAVWEWNRLFSFPDSRKTAFSIPKSPLQGWSGNGVACCHFPNPENQPFLLPNGSPAPVGKQNSRFSFPKSRKPAISVTRYSPSAGWEIARRSPQHKTRRQSRRAEITDARGRRPAPLSRSPSGNNQRRLR